MSDKSDDDKKNQKPGLKDSFLYRLGKGDSPHGKTIREVAEEFKSGWDKAREDGVDISPQYRRALIEDMGIHPDRVRAYVDALMDKDTPKPNPEDYKDPIVIKIDGPKPPRK